MLTVGTIVGMRYRILGVLGRGGMGVVYRAEHTGLKRQVALKVLDPTFAAANLEVRFEREARTAARLDHPGCVRVLDHGRTVDRQLYIAMELLEGQTLAAWLAAAGRLGVIDAVRTAEELLAALAHAHGLDVLHRDVKPENIVFAHRDGHTRVVLIDFGLARLRDDAAVTAAGVCMGSPSYVAPERLLAKPYDARADLYAVAVVLYEMLAGRPPFVGSTPLEIARRQIQDVPRPLRELRADVPADLDRVILRALAKEPLARFATTAAFGQALRTAIAPPIPLGEDELIIELTPKARPPAPPAPAPRSAPASERDASTQLAIPVSLRGPSLAKRAYARLRYGAWRWPRLAGV